MLLQLDFESKTPIYRQIRDQVVLGIARGALRDGERLPSIRALAAESGGADGVALINTLLGMRIDLKTKKPVLANKKGGFSGRAVFPVALRMVYDVYEAVHIPVIGMGGISRAEDVMEMMLAGASAVEVGAENLVDPFACRNIIRDLPRVMEKYGVKSLKEIIGGAHR